MTAESVLGFARRVAGAMHEKMDAPPDAPPAYVGAPGEDAWPAGYVAGIAEARAVVANEACRQDQMSRSVHFTVLWARSDRYKRPTVVAAWSEGYVDAYNDAYRQERDEKIRWFRDFGDPSDGPWSFWTTQEDLPIACEHEFQHHPESDDAGICSHCGAEEIDA